MISRNLAKTSVLIITLLFASFISKSQLRADFSANVVSGCAPIVVQFQDLSTGSPDYWRWDLGNGTISFLKNPSATYFDPGRYTIKLYVESADGEDSVVKTHFIDVYALPLVDINASQVSGCYPLPVQFTDATQNTSGTITQWFWDFGDGLSDVQQNPAHTYTAQGVYNVSLWVKNSFGCSNTITKSQYITVTTGINTSFTHSQPVSCVAPSTISFQNTSMGTGNMTYEWHFGDGTTSTDENPAHIYATNGSYTVKLIVRNNTGCSDSMVLANTVVIGDLQANFTTPTQVCENASVRFENTTVPVGANSLWDFGDGTTSTQTNPNKTYSTAGTYNVTLIVNSGNCSDTITKPITVLPKPTANFVSTPVSACSVPLTVSFQNNSTGADTYLWSFGDGNTSTAANPTHTYTSEGTYTVTLKATKDNGCFDTVTFTDLISIVLPSATIHDLPQEGCSPLTWTFTSSVIAADPVVSYLWNFGDGNTSTEESPTHIFNAGIFDITLIITTQNGCKDTVTVTEGIRVGDKPIVNFGATPRITCARTPIIFTDSTAGPVDRWLWDFGNGATSVRQNPEYKYRDTGTFDVTLIVWNMGCSDTLEIKEFIRIDPPIANFAVRTTCAAPFIRSFTNRSVGTETHFWDFADGNTSTLKDPVHTYTAPGTYRVMLVAYNSTTGCSDTTFKTLKVYDEIADFTTPDTVVCKKTPIPFTATANPENVTTYKWDFGDGGIGTGRTVHHSYQNSGVYSVKLIIITADNCSDTLIKQNYIHVSGPTANFTPTVPGTCSLEPVSLNDQSTSDGTNPIISWTWTYGDGVVETLYAAPFGHTYTAPGTYTINLLVTDSEGCTDKITKENIIRISKPRAQFNSPDSLTCPERTVTFRNTSSAPNPTYLWDFGDGNTSTERNPVHSYLTDGNFTVTLLVVDFYGCRDSITKSNYIKIVTPEANIIASDTMGTCPPLFVMFSNNSQNYLSWTWDFGDSTTSNAASPTHFYSVPGVYNASLTVTGPGGCTSTKVQPITVKGPQGTFTYDKTVGCDPLTVTFTASTRNRVSFVWDFNDGNTLFTTDSVVTHTYTRPGFYLPKMLLQDDGGCTIPVLGTDTIWVKGVEAMFTQNNLMVCDSGEVRFTNTSIATEPIQSFNWVFGDGSSASTEHANHIYNTPGVFTAQLSITTNSGCTSTFVGLTPTKVAASPKPAITQTADGCAPLLANFNAGLQTPDTSGVTWNWNFGNGITSTQESVTDVSYTNFGNYNVTLTATNGYGCTGNTTSVIKSFALPTVSAGGPTGTVCFGTPKQLNATGAHTYVWSPAQNITCVDCPDPLVNISTPAVYTVIGTTNEGCSDTALISLEIAHPFSITYSSPDSLCEGSSKRLMASGAQNYTWTPSTGLSNPNIANPIANPVVTTNYMVIGTDDKNCFSDTAIVPITVFPRPRVNAGNDITLNVGHFVDLVPEISADVTEVTWSPTGSIFRSDYPSITVSPKETTTYRVSVSNAGGCVAFDELTVHVICTGANIFIPNTFSPNNDGNNDVFYPRGTGLFRIKSAKVFNRWGEIVYQRNDFVANNAAAGWDGTYKGQKLSPDVFVYIVEVICDNNQVIPLKGNVALIK